MFVLVKESITRSTTIRKVLQHFPGCLSVIAPIIRSSILKPSSSELRPIASDNHKHLGFHPRLTNCHSRAVPYPDSTYSPDEAKRYLDPFLLKTCLQLNYDFTRGRQQNEKRLYWVWRGFVRTMGILAPSCCANIYQYGFEFSSSQISPEKYCYAVIEPPSVIIGSLNGRKDNVS